MSLYRFYCPELNQPSVELTGSHSHHLASVLRLAKGDKVELFDGKGSLAIAAISSINHGKTGLHVEQLEVVSKPNQPQITIAASIAKGERFDWMISKCTELGIDRILPVIFERTIKQPKNPKIVQRWQNLTISAAQQCGRLFLPYIAPPLQLRDVLTNLKKDFPATRILAGGLSGKCQSLAEVSLASQDTAAFVGPEGGLTKDEETFLENMGCQEVRLTNTILRVETAAIAFAAILATHRDYETQPAK